MKSVEDLLWAEFRNGVSDGMFKFMTSDELAAQVVRRDLREALKAGVEFTTVNQRERFVRNSVKSSVADWLEGSDVKVLIAKGVKAGVAKYLKELKAE